MITYTNLIFTYYQLQRRMSLERRLILLVLHIIRMTNSFFFPFFSNLLDSNRIKKRFNLNTGKLKSKKITTKNIFYELKFTFSQIFQHISKNLFIIQQLSRFMVKYHNSGLTLKLF